MIFSFRYSYIVLCVGIAAVFFWFGIDKFFHPAYWLDAWVPAWAVSGAATFGVTGTQFIYVNGILEVLIGLSLISGVFVRLFSALGVILLIAVLFVIGLNEIAVRDFGLIGGLLAVFLWPDRR